MAQFYEKDIEDYLYKNPEELNHVIQPFEMRRWLGRQVRLPSGIADLIGVASYYSLNTLVLVELKLEEINSETLTQISRYEADLTKAIRYHDGLFELPESPITKVAIGRTRRDNTFAEATALGILICEYELSFSLGGRIQWTEKFQAELKQKSTELAQSELIETYIRMFPLWEDIAAEEAAEEEAEEADSLDLLAEFEEAIRNAAANKREG